MAAKPAVRKSLGAVAKVAGVAPEGVPPARICTRRRSSALWLTVRMINARDNERQNLAFYNGLLRGIPVPTQSNGIQYQPKSAAAQLAGVGIAGLGAYNQCS